MCPFIPIRSRYRVTCLAAGLVWLVAGGDSHAANGTWSQTAGGTYTWSTAANWLSSAVPNGAGEFAQITPILTGSQTINLTNPISLGSFTLGSLSTLGSHSITLSGSAITMDNGGGNVVITKQLAVTAGRSSDSINNNLVLAGNLLVSNSTAASGFDFFVLNLRGTITESGGSRSVTVNAGSGVNLNNTANSYTGKTTVNSGYFSFASIGNVGMGNSSLGNPANAVDGTIALGSGNNEVFFRYTGTAADATTDRVLDFAGTNQTVNLSTVARKITYTSPFSFSGTGTKILQVASEGEVIISSSIAYGNLSFRAGSTTAAGTASLLGLNTFTGTTSIGRCSLTINSIAD